MKIIFLSLICLSLSSCATLEPDYTIFLKEERSIVENLKGDTCLESGYQIRKQRDDTYRLTVFYENCDVHVYRLLREREKEHWALPKELINE